MAPTVTDTDDETVTSDGTPGIELVKTADSATYSAGDVVTYTFTTTNTGTTTLSEVEVSDTGLTGLVRWTVTRRPPDLAPGEVLTCTGDEDDVPGGCGCGCR